MSKGFEERLHELEDFTSDDLIDLRPQTTREHLQAIYEVQKRTLRQVEDFNHFREKATKDIVALKTSDKVLGLTLVGALLAAVVLRVFGL